MPNLIPAPGKALSATDLHLAVQEALKISVKARPYTALITRSAPTAFLFLIDQSGSMAGEIEYAGNTCTKAEAVARVVNRTLYELLNRCIKGNETRRYYDIALIGYGGQSNNTANLLWEGPLAGSTFVSPADLEQHPKGYAETEVERTIRGRVSKAIEKRPYWLEPVANSLTPMKSAFERAETLLHQWLADHRGQDCYPPTVINITDGAATDAKDGELLTCANRIKQLHTPDGYVLLLNVHLSDAAGTPALFPIQTDELPDDQHAHLLYDLSSEMPANYHADIASLRRQERARRYVGMSFNADINALVKFMNIGTPMNENQSFRANIQPEP